MSFFPTTQIEFTDSASVDAFNRLRVSSPRTLLESKLIGDDDPLRWDDGTLSGSTPASVYSVNGSYTDIKVSATTTGTHARQTRERAVYHPGKSQMIYMTFVLNAAASGITRRVGYFDGNNGLFLEQVATGLRFVTRSNVTGSPVDTATASASWNVDKFDGTGPSGKTLDPTKGQILFIDFEWLSVGRVRWGFVIDGKIYIGHEDKWANNIAVPYMGVPNLPCRYEIANDGTGAASEMRCICASVSTEGGTIATGEEHGAQTSALRTITTAEPYPLVSVRKRVGFDGVEFIPDSVSIIVSAAIDYRWGIYLLKSGNGLKASGGGSFNWTAIQDSAIEADLANSGSPIIDPADTDVILLHGGVASSTNNDSGIQNISSVPVSLGTDVLGNKDVICLAVYPYTASSRNFGAGLNWSEIR